MDQRSIRALQGRLSPAEEEELRRWREAHPENERRFRKLRESWILSGFGASLAEAAPDPRTLRAEAERRSGNAPPAPALPSRPRAAVAPARWRRRLRIGALAASLVAVGFGLFQLVGHLAQAPTGLTAGAIHTGAGEVTSVTLSDGTSVRLGERSRLQFVEDGAERRLRLDGRAFLGVDHDPARPFVVETRHGEVVVRGTRFEVRSDGGGFRVVVLDGRVTVAAGAVEVEVGEGEMGHLSPGQPLSKAPVEDVYGHLEWTGDYLTFQATPLGRAVHEVERRYGVEIELEDRRLESLAVTATFTGAPLEDVVLVLCELAGVACDLGGEPIRIGTEAGAPPSPPGAEP